MPASAGIAQQIKVWKVQGPGTATPVTRRIAEKASQTFLIGTPVVVDTSVGYLQASPTISSALTIAGFATETASSLTTSGVAKTLTQTGNPPNQANAVFIPVGAWPNDGTCGVELACESNIFVGVMGNSSDGTLATIAVTDLTKIYGLTKDATNSFWYVDNNITAAGSGAICEIVELIDAVGTLNGRVAFKITRAGQQFGI